MMTDQEIARRTVDRLLSSKLIRMTAESLGSGVLEVITEAVAQGRREGERDGIDWGRAHYRSVTDAVTGLVNGMLNLPFPPANEEEEE